MLSLFLRYITKTVSLVVSILFLAVFLFALARTFFPRNKRVKEVLSPFVSREDESRKWERRCFFAALAMGLMLLAVFFVNCLYFYRGQGLNSAMEQFFVEKSIDAPHYKNLAQWGYDGTAENFPEQFRMIVFFPLFPWIMRPFVRIGIPFYPMAMLLNLFFFSAGIALAYRVIRRRFQHQTALWSVVFLVLMPGSFFFVMPMTESLFLFLSFAFLDCVETERFWSAGLLGVLAGLTRSPGLLLAGLAGAAMILDLQQKGTKKIPLKWIFPVLGPCLGIGGYLLLNQIKYGTPFAFLIHQAERWGQTFESVGSVLEGLVDRGLGWWLREPDAVVYVAIWNIAMILIELGLLAWTARKLPSSWLLHGLVYFAMVNGAATLLSGPRYALGMPALCPAMALACRRDWQKGAVAGFLFAMQGLYYLAFLRKLAIY